MTGARLSLILLLPPLLAAGAGPAMAQAGAGDRDRAASAQADQLFHRWHRPDSPGGSVLVMRHGEVLHARGYGMANLEHGVPNRTSTVFDIASVSKQFAAFAIAMLAQEGSLALEDDVRLHIPELPDFGDTIRIRHLVHHTGGLRDWPGTLRLAGWDYMDVVSYEQILGMARHQRSLNFMPGSDHAYSNTGYNLLAEIVSRVTGRSFRDWTHQRLFEPLGMGQTHFHDDWTEVVPGRAESYHRADDGSFRRVVSSLTAVGSSSLFTTIDDLARWLRNLDDPVVGGEEVARRMHERGVLSNGDTISYAFGLVMGEYRGATTASHGGSWGGYRSTLLRFPEHGLAVVILANASDLNAGTLAYRIADLYLADVLGPAPLPPAAGQRGSTAQAAPLVLTAAELAAYAGEYRSSELFTSYELSVEEGELVARHFRTGTTVLRPVAADTFQGPLFGRVEFLRDGDGAIRAFTANSVRVRGLRFDRVR
jgi:CubicO group peptidase (beta-lactamase class C family)